LLLSVGDSEKTRGRQATGGSYGYGKSALALNSRIRTIVAYSVFEPDETGTTARLMGCAYLDAHVHAGQQWTGRAWFGLPDDSKAGLVHPLAGDSAHETAGRLGFRRRGCNDCGTSILIVDPDVPECEALVRAIEEWWWPRLLDEELEVEVCVNGERLYPRPMQRVDLKPFIECYFMAVGRSQPQGSHQRCDRFNRIKGLGLGTFAFQLLDEDEARNIPEERVGSIAMVRSPKMVTQYAALGRDTPPAVGVFVADRDVDEILKLSEPPNHDRWDPESQRLQIADPNEETARRVVRQIHKRLKHQISQFQIRATPPRPPGERRVRFLERELATLFRPPTGGGTVGPVQTAPVEIRFVDGPAVRPASSGRVEAFSRIAVRLRADAEDDELQTIVRVRAPVLRDDLGIEDEPLPLEIESEELDAPPPWQREPEFPARLNKHDWLSFTVRTATYDRAWSVSVNVEVFPAETGQ